MTKVLAVMIWPSGIVGIGCLAAVISHRQPTDPLPATSEGPRISAPRWLRSVARPSSSEPAARAVVRLVATLACGALLIYAIVRPLGVLAVPHTGTLHRQFYNWIRAHQVHPRAVDRAGAHPDRRCLDHVGRRGRSDRAINQRSIARVALLIEVT